MLLKSTAYNGMVTANTAEVMLMATKSNGSDTEVITLLESIARPSRLYKMQVFRENRGKWNFIKIDTLHYSHKYRNEAHFDDLLDCKLYKTCRGSNPSFRMLPPPLVSIFRYTSNAFALVVTVIVYCLIVRSQAITVAQFVPINLGYSE